MVKLNTQENKKGNVELNNDLFPELEILDPTEIAKRLSAQGMIEAQKRNVGEGWAGEEAFKKKREKVTNKINGGKSFLLDGKIIEVGIDTTKKEKELEISTILPKTVTEFLTVTQENIGGKSIDYTEYNSANDKKTELNDSIATLQSNIAEKKEIYDALKSRIENNEHTQELKNEIENYNKDAQKINNEAKQLEQDVQENNKKLEQAIDSINKILENNQENAKSQSDNLKKYNQRAAKNINLMLNDAKFKDFWEKNNNTPEKSQIEEYCGEYIKNANIPSEEKKYLEALSPNIVSFLVSNKEDIKYGEDLKIEYDNNDFKINGVSQTSLETLKGKYATGAENSHEKKEYHRPDLLKEYDELYPTNVDFKEISVGNLDEKGKNKYQELESFISKRNDDNDNSNNLKTVKKIYKRSNNGDDYIIFSSMDFEDKNAISNQDFVYVRHNTTNVWQIYEAKTWTNESKKQEPRDIYNQNREPQKADNNYYPNRGKYFPTTNEKQTIMPFMHYDVTHWKFNDLSRQQRCVGLLRMEEKYIDNSNVFLAERLEKLTNGNNEKEKIIKDLLQGELTPDRQIKIQILLYGMWSNIIDGNRRVTTILEDDEAKKKYLGKNNTLSNTKTLEKIKEICDKYEETLKNIEGALSLNINKAISEKDISDLRNLQKNLKKEVTITPKGKKNPEIKAWIKTLNTNLAQDGIDGIRSFVAADDIDGRNGSWTALNKEYGEKIYQLIIPQNEVTTKFKVIQPDVPTGTTPEKLPFEPLSFEAPQVPELEQIKNPAYEEGKFQDQKVYLHNTPSLKLEGGFEKSTNDWLDEITNLRNEVWRKIRAKGFKRLWANPLADRTIKLEDNGLLAEEAVGVNDVEGITNLRKIFEALDYKEDNLKALFTSLKQGVKTFDELKEAAPGVYKLLKANIDAENHESGDSYDLGKMTEEEAREKALAKAKRDFATEDESKLFKREIRSEDWWTLRILYTSSGGGVARDALRAQYEVANNLSTDANLGAVKEQYYTQRLVLLLQQLETKSLKEIMRQNYTPKLKEEDRESELKPFKEWEGYNKLIKDSVAHLEDPEDKAAEKIARFEAIKKRIPQDRPAYRKISFLIGDIDLNATIDNADGKSAYKGQELSVLLDQMADYFTLKEGQEGEKRVIENIAKFIRQQDKTLKEDDLPSTDIEGFLNWMKGDYYRLLVVQKSLYHTGYDPRYILQYGDEAGAKALEDELVAVEKKKKIIGEIYEELLKEKEKVGKSIILNVRKELEAKAKEGTAKEFYAFVDHLKELGFIDPKTGGWREFDQMDDDRQRYIFGKTAAVIANSLFRGGKPILSPDGKTVNKDFFSIGIGGVVANLDNILEGLHVNGDVVMTNGSPSVNLWLGRSTGDIDLGKGRRIRWDAFAGASVGLESPKTIKDILAAGGAVTAGKDLNKTLDNLGVEEKHTLEATVGYSFPGVLSAGINYVRDFAAGVEEKWTGVEQRFGDLMDQVLDPIFNAGQLSELLNSTPGEENAARSTLIDALSQAFNDTKPEHTQKAADNIINFLRTYGEKAIAGDNSAERWEFVKHNLKRYFILNGRNQDNATLVDKGWHTSWAQIGLSWIIGSFTPRTLSLGYTQSRYLNLHYQDTAEAVAEDYMNNAAMIGYEDMAEIPTENYIAYINRRLEATHTYKLPDNLKLSVSGDYINVPRKLANANGGILSIEFAEDMKGEVKGNREGNLNLQSPEFIENQAVMQIPISAMMRFKETKTNEGVKNVLRFGEGTNYEGGKTELYGSGTEQPREVKTKTDIVEKPLSITEKIEFDNQILKELHLYEAQENQEYLMLLGYIDQMTNKTWLYNNFKKEPNKETLLAIIQSTVDEKQADKLVKNLDQKVRKQVKNWLNTYRPNIQAIIDALNSSETSDTDKQKIIDRMQQAFARIPRSLNTGEEVKTEVKKHRNIPKELQDLWFEELLEHLPETIQKTVDSSLIGYSAFYRQWTIPGLGATSLGGTSVLNERIGEGIIVEKELLPGSDAYQKAQDILFWEYQDKNGKVMGLKSEKDVQRRIEIVSKISDLIKRHTNKSVTIPDDPEKPWENLCRILKGEKFDIADNGTVTLNPEGKNSLQVATYIYLLGECANESVGFRIEGLTTTVSEEITKTEEGWIKPWKRYLSSYTRQTENNIEEAVRSLNVTVWLGKTEPAYGDTEQVREGDEGSGSGSDNREGDSWSGSGSGTGSGEAGGTDGR